MMDSWHVDHASLTNQPDIHPGQELEADDGI